MNHPQRKSFPSAAAASMGNEHRWRQSATNITSPEYFIFSAILLGPIAIGTIISVCWKYWWRRRARSSYSPSEEYFFGRQNISTILLALSMLNAVFVSALTIQGFAEEVYFEGSAMIWLLAPQLLAIFVAAMIFAPIYHTLNLTSIFNYLGLRYNNTVRLFASTTLIIQTVVVTSIALYAPAKLAVQVHEELHPLLVIPIVVAMTGIYTAFGGFRTVVYTSALQWLVVFAGLLLLIIIAALRAGGFDALLFTAPVRHNNTMSFLDDLIGRDKSVLGNPSSPRMELPYERHSIWSLSIGGFFTFLAYICVNQTAAHRYMATPLVRSTKRSNAAEQNNGLDDEVAEISYLSSTWTILGCFAVALIPMYIFFWLFGLIVAHSEGRCELDPDILSNFLLSTYGDDGKSHRYFGWGYFAAIFLAVSLTASIGSLSCALNSLTLLIMEDFVLPYYVVPFPVTPTTLADGFQLYSRSSPEEHDGSSQHDFATGKRKLTLDDKNIVRYARLVTICLALVIALCACFAPLDAVTSNGYLLEFALLIISALGGPILGLFFGGFFVPFFNTAGAMCGFVAALLINGYLLTVAILKATSEKENLACDLRGVTNYLPTVAVTALYLPAYPTIASTEVFVFDPDVAQSSALTATAPPSDSGYFAFVNSLFTLSQEISYILLSAVGVTVSLLIGFTISLISLLCRKCFSQCCDERRRSSSSFSSSLKVSKTQRRMTWFQIMKRRQRLADANKMDPGFIYQQEFVQNGRLIEPRRWQISSSPTTPTPPPYYVPDRKNRRLRIDHVQITTSGAANQLPLRLSDDRSLYSPQILMEQVLYEPSPQSFLLNEANNVKFAYSREEFRNPQPLPTAWRREPPDQSHDDEDDDDDLSKTATMPVGSHRTTDTTRHIYSPGQSTTSYYNDVPATIGNVSRSSSVSLSQHLQQQFQRGAAQQRSTIRTLRAKPVPPPKLPTTRELFLSRQSSPVAGSSSMAVGSDPRTSSATPENRQSFPTQYVKGFDIGSDVALQPVSPQSTSLAASPEPSGYENTARSTIRNVTTPSPPPPQRHSTMDRPLLTNERIFTFPAQFRASGETVQSSRM